MIYIKFVTKYSIYFVYFLRTGLTPGGSKPNSRPASRGGSKPPSRHGSNLSLDSNDDNPTRIPQRRVTTTSTPRPSRLSVGSVTPTTKTNGVSTRTPSGAASPAPTR